MLRGFIRDTNWLVNGAPEGASVAVCEFLSAVKELASTLGNIIEGSPRAPKDLVLHPLGCSVDGAARRGSRKNIQLDMDRIFAQRVEVYKSVNRSCESILQAVLRISFKALSEHIRLETFGKHGYQQLQIDLSLLRTSLPSLVDNSTELAVLLEEGMTSTGARCLEPVSLDSEALREMLRVYV